MTTPSDTGQSEITDEQIYEQLKQYQELGVIGFVLPTEPLGEQWIVGHGTEILKFATKEGIIGFLMGMTVLSAFFVKLKAAQDGPIWEHPAWGAVERQAEAMMRLASGEARTEYGTRMSGGGVHVRWDSPQMDRIDPVGAWTKRKIGNGCEVVRRRVVPLGDWEDVSAEDAAKMADEASGEPS